MNTWWSSPDTTPETAAAVQAGLTVRMVMTERQHLMTCRASESVGSIMAKNVNQFSFLPVVKDEVIRGLYNAERWFVEVPPAPEAAVGEDFEVLTEDHLIGADTSLLDFVLSAAERPRLVVAGSQIVGLVCLADLNKLPVRTALFGLVTTLEMLMAERIENWSNGVAECWLATLSCGRRKKVEKKITRLRKDDMLVSEIMATEFEDKVDVIVKRGMLEGSKTGLRKEFWPITKLRNALAHAGTFAATRAEAGQVPRTVEAMLKFMDQLRRRLQP